MNAKQRVTVVSNILQTTQERLDKVHNAVEKDTAKRKSLLDHSFPSDNSGIIQNCDKSSTSNQNNEN